MKVEYNTCSVDGCDNHKRKTFGDLCHYHKGLIKYKKCARIYIKHLVEWCDKFEKRVDNLECDSCDNQLEPVDNIEMCEEMRKKGL